MPEREHWDGVYARKQPDEVSWYAPHLETSLELITAVASAGARIIDVGAGASTLPGDLLQRGFDQLTVLDISAHAVDAARAQLGERAKDITFLVADVTHVSLPPASFDVWHDRAVFHFLTDPDLRQRYVDTVRAAVKPGGHVIVATFGPEGPERCSGLQVARFDAAGIHAEFGGAFVKLDSRVEEHETPWGAQQQFVYCLCRVEEPAP